MGNQPVSHDESGRRGPVPLNRPVYHRPCRTAAKYKPPRGKGVRRGPLCLARKSIANRYYQLLSGHAAIGPYLKDKIRKTDDDQCWWCGGGKKHLFTECRAWCPQITRWWKDIGKACGWKHPRAPSVKWLWKEKATEAVLVFLWDTRVGCISTRRKPPEEGCDVVGSGDEGDGGGPGQPQMQFLLFPSFPGRSEGIGDSFFCHSFCHFLCLSLFLFLCLAVRGLGDQGTLLGSIRSIWDRKWSCKSSLPLLRPRDSK